MIRFLSPILVLSVVAGCRSPADLSAPDQPALSVNGNGKGGKVTGSFAANIGAAAPIIGQFELTAQIDKRGATKGEFTFFADTPTGTIEFDGRVTCVAFNDELKRAWIGAVITRNGSTRPSHDGTLAIHQVGHDVWFRVADRSPGGSGEPDRTTFLGFEGGGGILTSAEYCSLRIWPNDAIAILSGNLTVH
jgi:hypothetical protein